MYHMLTLLYFFNIHELRPYYIYLFTSCNKYDSVSLANTCCQFGLTLK
uniref:Uncharacterized protein n=1 Tax=Arundo donax TaxID=35708 RepID=A0A0A9GMQ8_ARUDO